MPEILRLYRDLIVLRKQHPSLGNCRKDLTEIQVRRASEISRYEEDQTHRASAALMSAISPENAQSIPVAVGAQAWRLALLDW